MRVEAAAATRELIERHYAHLAERARPAAAAAENVLVQVERLAAWPLLRDRPEVVVRGLVHDERDGRTFAFDPDREDLVSLTAAVRPRYGRSARRGPRRG